MKRTLLIMALAVCLAAGVAALGCDGGSADYVTTVSLETTTTTAAAAGTTTTVAAATTTTAAPTKATTTTAAPSGPAAQEHLLKGTWTWDIDGDGTDDLWNDVVDELVQFLRAEDGAQLTRITGRTFVAVTLSDLQAVVHWGSELSVEGVDDPNVIMVGDVIALKTSDGEYAKLKVIGFESFTGSDAIPYPRYNIRFKYVLYP